MDIHSTNVMTGDKTTRDYTSGEQTAVDASRATKEARVTAALRYITFDDFKNRFTAQEWDASTDHVYEVNTTTGKPKRKALIQGLADVQATNSVDLLAPKASAFLAILVTGGVITTERKTEILTP